jgi:hypothetical protein
VTGTGIALPYLIYLSILVLFNYAFNF